MFLLFLSLDDLDSIVAFEAIYCQDKSVKNCDERCLNINLDFMIFYELIVKINRVLRSLFCANRIRKNHFFYELIVKRSLCVCRDNDR